MDQEITSGEIPEVVQPDTAPVETEVVAPETTEVVEDKPASKSFTQEEVDAIVGKRLARELRKLERDQAAKAIEAQPAVVKTDLRLEDFGSPEEYAQVLADRIAEQKLTAKEQHKQQSSVYEAYSEREEAARDKYDDYDQVALNKDLPITPVMAKVIMKSEIGPDILYFLGSEGIKDAKRISQLPFEEQAFEIGQLQAKLASSPVVKKTTSAPAPIVPVTARSAANPSYDTTDPRSIKAMSTSEWIEAERKRQIKKAEANKY